MRPSAPVRLNKSLSCSLSAAFAHGRHGGGLGIRLNEKTLRRRHLRLRRRDVGYLRQALRGCRRLTCVYNRWYGLWLARGMPYAALQVTRGVSAKMSTFFSTHFLSGSTSRHQAVVQANVGQRNTELPGMAHKANERCVQGKELLR